MPTVRFTRNGKTQVMKNKFPASRVRRTLGRRPLSRWFSTTGTIGVLPTLLSFLMVAPLCWSNNAAAQTGAASLVDASAMKELPLKAWGPYSRAHLAPACLVNQILGQQFVFPLVIAQEQQAVLPVRSAAPDGKPTQRLSSVILQRRAMGMSPMQAGGDDSLAMGPLAPLNRRAQIVDANGDGLLWTYRVVFAPAALSQANATLKTVLQNEALKSADNPTGANGIPAGAWGAGEATVECFPAFGEPDGDGLLLRVTLANRSQTAQTYCVDLLGGMDAPGPTFTTENFLVQAPPGLAGAVVQHSQSPAFFALLSGAGGYRARGYRVSGAYFEPAGAVALRDEAGVAIPRGLLAPRTLLPDSGNEADRKDSAKEAQKAARIETQNEPRPSRRTNRRKSKSGDATADAVSAENAEAARLKDLKENELKSAQASVKAENEGQYGLTRVDDIAVAPGQSVTFFLSVGVGKDAEAARSSAQTLLSVAGSGQTGAYGEALKAHQSSRFHSGNVAMDRLMTQSLVNAPNVEGRRIGVGTRQARPGHLNSLYDSARDAMMAIGWTAYRPNLAAAQLNAWFQTKNNADEISGVPLRNPRATPPTNLFALWELYEHTHSRALLKRYYPFARRRYLELLAAGRAKEDVWSFAWPSGVQDAIFVPGSTPPTIPQTAKPNVLAVRNEIDKNDQEAMPVLYAAPDYAAYVIRAARILQAIATITDVPVGETRQYAIDAYKTAQALNATLWDAERKMYVPAPLSKSGDIDGRSGRSDTLAGLLPLIAGADMQSGEQRAALIETLTDPEAFWSPGGLRAVSKTSPLYRAGESASGAVRFGLNWLFWKALLDGGETDTARKLATNLLLAYEKAQAASGQCPEWLHGDTSAGGGIGDFAGDASAFLPMWAAYHQTGTVTGGWNVNLLDTGYNRGKDALHLIVKRLQPAGKVALVCVLGKANGHYVATGAISGPLTADADGILTLTLPQDNTTLVIDLAPAN